MFSTFYFVFQKFVAKNKLHMNVFIVLIEDKIVCQIFINPYMPMIKNCQQSCKLTISKKAVNRVCRFTIAGPKPC